MWIKVYAPKIFCYEVVCGTNRVKGTQETPIRRLAAKNLALPHSRELEAQLLPHVNDVVTIMT